MSTDNTHTVRARPPAGLCIGRVALPSIGKEDGGRDWGILASKRFGVGDVLFTGRVTTADVPVTRELQPIQEFTTVTGEVVQVVPHVHCVPRGTRTSEARTFDVYGFDSFMNHSCDPNTSVVYNDENIDVYAHIAARPIAEGDQVTVSYDDVYYAAAPLRMRCSCGSANCSGERDYGTRVPLPFK